MNGSSEIQAVTFDFFETLIRHRQAHGRGRSISDYLRECGYASPPDWHDGALYRVFEIHAAEYSTELADAERSRYLTRLASRVFEELDPGADEDASRHAEAIWEILGPSAFAVYPDVYPILESLQENGVKLAIISNWHSGVEHFVSDLGLAPYFDHVIGSADCGFAKPDRRIFDLVRGLLDEPAERILHVGDSYEADYQGARGAGYRVALLERGVERHPEAERVLRSLTELPGLLADIAR